MSSSPISLRLPTRSSSSFVKNPEAPTRSSSS
ncbi:hypothetical protein F441_01624 [Phytophthora nicotianae CJ01A1]|uniref:Uncharacterized protein n=3 Tax=Phytophthora nicotianae TaxID=4792 RepID=V9FY36_PHYNI|nr:hypothetical protein F443_01661 [Phytophthora nicotianae P1569]ETP25514.1 hypothetical protein F441_01624 [Phytophthora nicotianae CJ01A1]ETP53512.1 hypothetical protein F442_01602 [Phytophthora nicotianae P10297]